LITVGDEFSALILVFSGDFADFAGFAAEAMHAFQLVIVREGCAASISQRRQWFKPDPKAVDLAQKKKAALVELP